MRPDALVFDVDGTLAETEELHRRAFNETFAAAGLDWCWSRDDYRRLLRTTGGKERIARYMAEIGEPPGRRDIPALHRAKTDRYTRLVAQGGLDLREGIAALIAEARTAGLRLAVATTTSRRNVEALCHATFGQAAGAVFDTLACGDEVAAKKPAPDVYRLALDRLRVRPQACIAFEDSANGLRAALGAGLACVVTPSTYTAGEDFTGALCTLDTIADLGGLGGLSRRIAALHNA
jgi:HAD superfamily hydrolase (TIGR01509 family)